MKKNFQIHYEGRVYEVNTALQKDKFLIDYIEGRNLYSYCKKCNCFHDILADCKDGGMLKQKECSPKEVWGILSSKISSQKQAQALRQFLGLEEKGEEK